MFVRDHMCVWKSRAVSNAKKGGTRGPTIVCHRAPDPRVGQEPAMGKPPPGGNAWDRGYREKQTQSPEGEKQGVFQEEQKEGPCGWGTE